MRDLQGALRWLDKQLGKPVRPLMAAPVPEQWLGSWLLGGETRMCDVHRQGGMWFCALASDEPYVYKMGRGATRDAAITDARRKWPAATPEGGEDRGA